MKEYINGGFSVISKTIFDHIKPGMELEDEVYKSLARQNGIVAFKYGGFWKSMNTLKDNIELNELWANEKPPWMVWKNVE